MIITIDLVRVGNALAQMIGLFGLEFIAFGFAKATLNKQSKMWERILGIIEIVLVFGLFSCGVIYHRTCRTGRRTRPVFAQNDRNQRRNESFSQFGAENSQNGNFRRTQNGAERKIQKSERINVRLFHCAKVLMYENNRIWSVL